MENNALRLSLEWSRFPFPLNFLLSPIAHAPGSRDFHGVNYYTRELVRFDPTHPGEVFGRRFIRPDSMRNDPGRGIDFGEIYPYGLYRVLKPVYRNTRGNKPLYITENGFTDAGGSDEYADVVGKECLCCAHLERCEYAAKLDA